MSCRSLTSDETTSYFRFGGLSTPSCAQKVTPSSAGREGQHNSSSVMIAAALILASLQATSTIWLLGGVAIHSDQQSVSAGCPLRCASLVFIRVSGMFPEGPPAMKDRLKDRPLMARYGQPKGLVGVGHAHSLLSRNSQRLGQWWAERYYTIPWPA